MDVKSPAVAGKHFLEADVKFARQSFSYRKLDDILDAPPAIEVEAAALLSEETTKYLVAVVDDVLGRFSKEAGDTYGITLRSTHSVFP